MAQFSVIAESLENAAGRMLAQADQYEQTAGALKSAAEGLAATWEGDASVAFTQEQDGAYNWYMRMAAVVREYADAMKRAAQAYRQADADAAAGIRAN